MPFLLMQGITKRFGATVALDQVGLQVEPGEILALVGENGSGKSTLMKILAGAQPPDDGSMTLADKPYQPSDPAQARRAGVAMIYQELSLCPDLTIWENIVLGTEITRGIVIDRTGAKTLARQALTTLDHGDLDLDRTVRTLPIATRQIVEIARAVASNARIVVLDEPTSSLSHADAERLFEVVENLAKNGHAVIYISHFLEEVLRLSNRITVLRDGRNVAELETKNASIDQIVSAMVGRNIDSMYPHSTREPGEPILELDALQTEKGTSSVILRRGEVLGIAGLNGSGRTELLRALFGLDAVNSGRVKVATAEGPASPQQRWNQGVGMVSEDRKEEGLALDLPIAENLLLTKLPMFISSKWEGAQAEKWIDKMGVRCRDAMQPVGALSGGNQQKVAIGRLLAHDVDILLIDEPTRGIDVGSKSQIYKLIDDLASQGKAVLLVSSYLPELLGICDSIAVMHKGVLGPKRPVSERNSEEIMREATGV